MKEHSRRQKRKKGKEYCREQKQRSKVKGDGFGKTRNHDDFLGICREEKISFRKMSTRDES